MLFRSPFVGKLASDRVTGTLGGERVSLKSYNDAADAMDYKSLAEWCDFWRGVPRCRGVEPVCRSISSRR